MMQNLKEIENNIEVVRQKLNNLIIEKEYKLVNAEVVILSQQLDSLLDKYNKLSKNHSFYNE